MGRLISAIALVSISLGTMPSADAAVALPDLQASTPALPAEAVDMSADGAEDHAPPAATQAISPGPWSPAITLAPGLGLDSLPAGPAHRETAGSSASGSPRPEQTTAGRACSPRPLGERDVLRHVAGLPCPPSPDPSGGGSPESASASHASAAASPGFIDIHGHSSRSTLAAEISGEVRLTPLPGGLVFLLIGLAALAFHRNVWPRTWRQPRRSPYGDRNLLASTATAKRTGAVLGGTIQCPG